MPPSPPRAALAPASPGETGKGVGRREASLVYAAFATPIEERRDDTIHDALVTALDERIELRGVSSSLRVLT